MEVFREVHEQLKESFDDKGKQYSELEQKLQYSLEQQNHNQQIIAEIKTENAELKQKHNEELSKCHVSTCLSSISD